MAGFNVSTIEDESCLAYSIPGAKHALGVSHQVIYNLLNSGKLRSFKINRRRLISRQAILDLIAEREIEEAERLAVEREIESDDESESDTGDDSDDESDEPDLLPSAA